MPCLSLSPFHIYKCRFNLFSTTQFVKYIYVYHTLIIQSFTFSFHFQLFFVSFIWHHQIFILPLFVCFCLFTTRNSFFWEKEKKYYG